MAQHYSETGILKVINTLNNHKDIIKEAYENKRILKTEENQQKIETLLQYKILVQRDQETFSLETQLQTFFDNILSSENLYIFKTDFGELFRNLQEIAEIIKKSFYCSYEDVPRLETEFISILREITDNLIKESSKLKQILHNDLENIQYAKTKIDIKEKYLTKAEEIFNVLEDLLHSRLKTEIQTQDIFASLRSEFFYFLFNNHKTVLIDIKECLEKLRKSLFELKKTQVSVRKIKLFRNLYQEIPDWAPIRKHTSEESVPVKPMKLGGALTFEEGPLEEIQRNILEKILKEVPKLQEVSQKRTQETPVSLSDFLKKTQEFSFHRFEKVLKECMEKVKETRVISLREVATVHAFCPHHFLPAAINFFSPKKEKFQLEKILKKQTTPFSPFIIHDILIHDNSTPSQRVTEQTPKNLQGNSV